MSYKFEIALFCDFCENEITWNKEDESQNLAFMSRFRAHAKQEGWTTLNREYTPDIHYCKSCSDKPNAQNG